MQTITLVGLFVVATFTLLHTPQPAAGECCASAQRVISHWVGRVAVLATGVGIREALCNDCTPPTPYCGHGKCNIFGCNCNGGCRQGGCSRRRRSTDGAGVSVHQEYANVSTIVSFGDGDGDGALSMKEAEFVLKRCGIVARPGDLCKLDINNDGKLTPQEIDPSQL